MWTLPTVLLSLKMAFPIAFDGSLNNLHQLLATRTQSGNTLIDQLVAQDLIPQVMTTSSLMVRAWQHLTLISFTVKWFMSKHL